MNWKWISVARAGYRSRREDAPGCPQSVLFVQCWIVRQTNTHSLRQAADRSGRIEHQCKMLVLVWCQFWCSLTHNHADADSRDLSQLQQLTVLCRVERHGSDGL